MKARLLIPLMLAAAPLVPQAASRLELGRWMRAIDAKSVSVQKALAAGRQDEAVADAQALQKLYADMTAFFEQDYPAADAVGFARDGERLAAAIPTALAAATSPPRAAPPAPSRWPATTATALNPPRRTRTA